MRHIFSSATSLPDSTPSEENLRCQFCGITEDPHLRPGWPFVLAWDARFDAHGVLDRLRVLCHDCAAAGKFCTWPLEDARNFFDCVAVSRDLVFSPRADTQIRDLICAPRNSKDSSQGA